jgi:hypothetical protein
MRSREEIQTAIEILRLTGEKVDAELVDKTISNEQAEEMRGTVNRTLGLLNWVMGADTDNLPTLPVITEVTKYAENVSLFKDLS